MSAVDDILSVMASGGAAAQMPHVEDHAEAVQSYREARGWLFRHTSSLDMDGICRRGHPLTPLMIFVCALYWVSPNQLRADLAKTWKEVGG